jgi:hypothetical protein
MARTLTDEAFEALKKTIVEIDFRAKRLTEWRELGMRLQNAESRFDVFFARWPSSNLPAPGDLPLLSAAWTDCDQQIIELGLLPDSFMTITTLVADRTADGTVKGWVDDLVAAGKKVGDDLAQKRFGDLAVHAAEYKAAYTKVTIVRNAKINTEVNLLAALTNELKLRFE